MRVVQEEDDVRVLQSDINGYTISIRRSALNTFGDNQWKVVMIIRDFNRVAASTTSPNGNTGDH